MLRRRRYVLTDQIGAGGMGSVWRAWDIADRRWVAAKVLGRYDGGSLERFVREQRLRVRHRHVVAPSDCAVDRRGDRLFTMDLVRGGSVEGLLARHGPLPEGYVRLLLEQTLEALVAVHAAGVVHRDVKPGNLLLEPTGTGRPWVRLGDFGIAAVLGEDRLTRVPGGVGTSGYMAPEQSAGSAPDPRQDLYAAGVVAVQLLGGGAPGGPPPLGAFGALLARLADLDPEGRPPSAVDALSQLHALGPTRGARCQEQDPPDVTDLFGDAVAPAGFRRPRVPAYAWASLATFAGATVVGGAGSWVLLR